MKKLFRFLGVVLLIAAVSAGTTLTVLKYGTTNSQISNLKSKISNDSLGISTAYSRFASLPQAGETDFTQAAELSVNAVVHVKTTYRNQMSSQQMDLFEYFFGRPGQQREMPAQQASGSGVIISEDGYIVTNNHVIDRADQIQVVLNDKREYTATLVGTDPNTDIALLKIEETGLPVILMGNSDDLRVGEWVLAVGNPFNLTSTVTAGIVSAKARNINILNAEMKIESFIQTDAAVNPGNSGGALVAFDDLKEGVALVVADAKESVCQSAGLGDHTVRLQYPDRTLGGQCARIGEAAGDRNLRRGHPSKSCRSVKAGV